MYKIDLCHLGDNCEPGMLIDSILNINRKCLFMLGIYELNNIIKYLYDNNYEKIYDTNHFYIGNDPKLVSHTLYNFKFNHDYIMENKQITNYDFIKNRFDEKIKNFRNMLQSPNKTIFINFTENVDKKKINEILAWQRIHKNNSHLIIFTNNPYSNHYNSPQLSIIHLEHSYQLWWEIEKPKRIHLYKEIYDKFLNCLKENNIDHNFPMSLKETSYGKTYNI
uniref:Papain-like cysteine peptidase n=1 Tax=viral metagenome TaxID=1070528 RepID=A0A6C0BB20_9ZZZZ